MQVPRPIVAGVVGQVGPVTAWTMSGRSGPAAVASSALLALIRQPTDRDDPSARIAARAAAELTAGALLDRVDGPSRQPNPRAALLGRARRFMSDHLHEADLSPACVAASIPISERYLFRRRLHTGDLAARGPARARAAAAGRRSRAPRPGGGRGGRHPAGLPLQQALPRALHRGPPRVPGRRGAPAPRRMT